MTSTKSRIFARIGVMAMVVALVAPLAASAATITSGNLTLGDSRPGQTTTYNFSGSNFSVTSLKCIQLKFAINADGSGGAPSGLTTTGATLSSSTLITPASWTVGNAAGLVKITNATGEAPSSTGNVVWGGVVNGNTADTTYYALLSTYTNTDCATGPVDSTVVAFMYKDGALVTMTVDPTLTFTVAGVASGQTVNGATTTLASNATSIDFARLVNSTTKGVSAHDVTVSTNGGGFAVYLKQSGNFSNGTHTITPWTGTNGSPTAFPAAGTEAWGYTTNDNDLLTGGTNTRFTSNTWAGMPTTNELVGDRATLGSQTTRVGHQLGVSTSTPAGSYSTTLVYTAAGTY